jgi:predicted phage baseplate assembly protein
MANAIPVRSTAKARPDGETVRWSPRPDLLDVAAADRAFVAEMDDDGFAHVRFAADPASRPARGTSLLARYRVGLGPDGNVGPDSIALVVSEDTIAGGVEFTVRNPLAAAGGMAPESLADARLLAPNAFRRIRERAVIAADYAELLQRELGAEVQGAASALRWTGSWYEAQVGVDARGSESASAKLLRRARGVLHRYRRIGHDVRVSSARLVPLAVTLDVCVAPHAPRAAVRAALLSALGSGRTPDGRLGFFHPDNLRYGEGVSVSALVAAAARVSGVASVAVTKLERLGEGPNQEIENGILPVGAMEIAQLDNDPSFPERGTLVITMRGGR